MGARAEAGGPPQGRRSGRVATAVLTPQHSTAAAAPPRQATQPGLPALLHATLAAPSLHSLPVAPKSIHTAAQLLPRVGHTLERRLQVGFWQTLCIIPS